MSRLSKIIDADKSKRFDENFNPDEIGLMLENFYFNQMRKRLFSEYLRSPNEETIKVIVREFDEIDLEIDNKYKKTQNAVDTIKMVSYARALCDIKNLLEEEHILIPVKD